MNIHKINPFHKCTSFIKTGKEDFNCTTCGVMFRHQTRWVNIRGPGAITTAMNAIFEVHEFKKFNLKKLERY